LDEAAREVFSKMLNSEIQLAPAGTMVPNAELTALIGLAGQLRGVCVLRCTPAAADLMAAKMLNIDPEPAGDETWDAMGEVCNMVAGNFKNKLPGLGEYCMLSCPTVIAGNDYKCQPLAGGQSMSVTLLFEGTPLLIALEIHE
jgi:chemotaxis protein CheX